MTETTGRMVQISDFIKELQETQSLFGNTCVYIRDVSWGAVALNRKAQDDKDSEAATEKQCECRNLSSRMNGTGYVCDECGKEWEYGENVGI